jgi:hypothetical protein
MSATYAGTCFCGAVGIEVSGEPQGIGFCHCTSCREWSGAPINAFTLWKGADVKVTKGEDSLGSYTRNGIHDRKFCKHCGGHLLTAIPSFDVVDVFAATIPDFPFTPALHVHYAETVLPMRDGLPKFKDYPASFGGSDEMMAE